MLLKALFVQVIYKYFVNFLCAIVKYKNYKHKSNCLQQNMILKLSSKSFLYKKIGVY